ncbi:hypothetical protein ACW73L_18375 [Methylolobus aquaticus]
MNATTQQRTAARREFVALTLFASATLLAADRAHADVSWRVLRGPMHNSAAIAGFVEATDHDDGTIMEMGVAVVPAECQRGMGTLLIQERGTRIQERLLVRIDGTAAGDGIFRSLCGKHQ